MEIRHTREKEMVSPRRFRKEINGLYWRDGTTNLIHSAILDESDEICFTQEGNVVYIPGTKVGPPHSCFGLPRRTHFRQGNTFLWQWKKNRFGYCTPKMFWSKHKWYAPWCHAAICAYAPHIKLCHNVNHTRTEESKPFWWHPGIMAAIIWLRLRRWETLCGRLCISLLQNAREWSR